MAEAIMCWSICNGIIIIKIKITSNCPLRRIKLKTYFTLFLHKLQSHSKMPQFQMRVPCTAATKRFQIPAALQQSAIVAEVQQRAIAGETTECNAMQLNQCSAVQQDGSTMECSATGWSATGCRGETIKQLWREMGEKLLLGRRLMLPHLPLTYRQHH